MNLLVRATAVVVTLELFVSSFFLFCFFLFCFVFFGMSTIGGPPWVYRVKYYFAEIQSPIDRFRYIPMREIGN